MKQAIFIGRCVPCMMWMSLWLGIVGTAMGEIAFQPSWQPVAYRDVRQQVLQWVENSPLEEHVEQQARSLWPSADLRETPATELLDRVVETFALADPRAQALVQAYNAPQSPLTLPEAPWLNQSELPLFYKNQLRLYLARRLTQLGFYGDVLQVLDGMSPTEVIDPASLLFCRVVAHHQLVQPDLARAALVQLLEQEEALPLRYHQLAQLVQHDLAGLKDESLDHIARRMNDVRQRLERGRAGEQVQLVEKGIVDSLDQLIDQLEQQQQQQCSCSSGSAQGARPLEQSQLPSLQAPMQVDQRDIGHESGWGNLPPKQREQALQQISREFPAHYRDLIEQYFRELATEASTEPSPN